MEQPKGRGILRNKGAEVHRHIKWDQQSLRLQQLERGKIPKIPEPKTPYCASDDEEDNVEDLELKSHLEEARENRNLNRKREGLDINKLNQMLKKEQIDPQSEEEDQEQRRKAEEFRKKRAEHYKVQRSQLKRRVAEEEQAEA